MGIAGPENPAVTLGKGQQRGGKIQRREVQPQQLVLEEEPDVAGDLVVAGAAGVEPLAGTGGLIGEPVLDRGV